MGMFDDFLNLVPNAAGDANASLAPVTAPLRTPAGRLDSTVIKSAVPPELSEDTDMAVKLGNLKADAINGYKPEPLSWHDWLGGALQEASIPLAYAQGNRDYANAMLGNTILAKHRALDDRFSEERAKAGLDNQGSTIDAVGKVGLDYIAQRRELRLSARQNAAKAIAAAGISARMQGQDETAAQAQTAKNLAASMRAQGFKDDADELEKQFQMPTPSAPVPTPTPAPAMGLGGPPPAGPMPSAPAAGPAAATSPGIPDFAQGLRVAAGGPEDIGEGSPTAPASQAPPGGNPAAPPPVSHTQVYGATAKQYQDIADSLRPFDPEQAKVWDERAKTMLGKMNFKTMKNADGEETGVFVNEANPLESPREFTPGETDDRLDLTAAMRSGVKGKDFLTLLEQANPVDAAAVKKMISGDVPPPANFSSQRNPKASRLLAYASQIEPGFSYTRWGARNAAMKSFYGNGDDAKNVRSLNQTVHHVGKLIQVADAMKNNDYPAANAIMNELGKQLKGSGKLMSFNLAANAVADEMGKVFKGSNLSDTEIEHWKSQLSPHMSPEQQRAALTTLMGLLQGATDAIDKKRMDALGPDLVSEKGPLIGPREQMLLERVEKWENGGAFEPMPEIPEKAKFAFIKNTRGLDDDKLAAEKKKFDAIFGDGASSEVLGDYR